VWLDEGVTRIEKFEDLGHAARKVYIDISTSASMRKDRNSGATEPPVSPGGAVCTETINLPGQHKNGWLLYSKAHVLLNDRGSGNKRLRLGPPRLFRTRAQRSWFEIAARRRTAAAAHIIEQHLRAKALPPGQTRRSHIANPFRSAAEGQPSEIKG